MGGSPCASQPPSRPVAPMSLSPDFPPTPAADLVAAPAHGASSIARTPYLDLVRQAWRATAADTDPRADRLALALHAFARDGRARGAPVESLLGALDRLSRWVGHVDDVEPGFERVRDWAGTVVIRAYYGVG